MFNKKAQPQRWWKQAGQHCERFLEASATLNTYATQEEIAELIETMRDCLAQVERIRYSPAVAPARQHLLSAMRGMLHGFEKSLVGDFQSAEDDIEQAHRALRCFDEEMGELVA